MLVSGAKDFLPVCGSTGGLVREATRVPKRSEESVVFVAHSQPVVRHHQQVELVRRSKRYFDRCIAIATPSIAPATADSDSGVRERLAGLHAKEARAAREHESRDCDAGQKPSASTSSERAIGTGAYSGREPLLSGALAQTILPMVGSPPSSGREGDVPW